MTYVPPPRRTPLRPGRSRLRASPRAVAAREVRRAIVDSEMAAAHGRCRRCGQPATEVHEPVGRARRPGCHLRPEFCLASCRSCNEFAVTHPSDAEAEGWVIASWVPEQEAIAITARWKAAR